MAEKSSELNYTNGINAETESNDSNLEIVSENYSSSEDETAEIGEVEPEQIREQIEETRSQMSETIDAIQEKLSIANITEQVKDQVSEQIGNAVDTAKDAFYERTSAIAKTVGRNFGLLSNSDLAKKTQENPWILSVVGMGIGAILVGALSNSGKRKSFTSVKHKNFAADYNAEQTRQKFKSEEISESNYQQAHNRVNNSAETIQEKVDSATSSTFANITNVADSAYQGIGSAAGKTYESFGKASSFAYEKASDLGEEMKKNYENYIEKNPLAVGAVAFAVGAAIGYAVPLTKTENQYFGEMRDKVLDKAQTSAQDAIGTVKQAVGEAQQMLVDEVKSQTAS